MKRILITGAGSYIGTSVEQWLNRPEFAGMYQVDTVDMRGDEWKKKDFSGYDTVFHVAGIAHIKETKKNAELYYKVNRDLAVETAKKAKREGVSQFILLSSMSVYGMLEGVISCNTLPNPKNNYGKSKLEADEIISKMQTNKFGILILRPPMVYGKECKGNYKNLEKIVDLCPIFPLIENQRSVLYINNLCKLMESYINQNKRGILHPRDIEKRSTYEMVREIAKNKGKHIYFVSFLRPVILIIKSFPNCLGTKIKKAFGDLYYSDELE